MGWNLIYSLDLKNLNAHRNSCLGIVFDLQSTIGKCSVPGNCGAPQNCSVQGKNGVEGTFGYIFWYPRQL